MPEERYEEVARRYGLEPVPESVARLTKLVASQDADIDEIAKVIEKDKNLTSRLLRAANRGATDERDYDITSVDQALLRNGMGCVLLLAMGDPLMRAVAKTFQTMLSLKAEMVNPARIKPFEGEHVLGSVEFSGKASGVVRIRLAQETARLLAARLLGLQPNELTSNSDVDDGIGELVNIIVGNFKSNLCDAGLDCKLTSPRITRTHDAEMRTVRGGGAERLAFRTSDIAMLVDVSANPWAG